MIFGLCGCFLSGLSYLLAAVGGSWPIFSPALLCLGRVILGIGQSFAGTGSTLWGGRGGPRCISGGLFRGTVS